MKASCAAIFAPPSTVTTVPVESVPMPVCVKTTWYWALYVPVTVTAPDTVKGLAGDGAGVVSA